MLDSDDRIDASLVKRLVASQFPQWAQLPVAPVENSGWDNRTFHLGSKMSVRLPSGPAYAPAVQKEQKWLPILAPNLSQQIPKPLALGQPSDDFPWHWSVYQWLQGEVASRQRVTDLNQFAKDLARFLMELQQVDAQGGPVGTHRGGSLQIWDEQAQAAITALRGKIDGRKAKRLWAQALSAPFNARRVWFHGDVAAGNLLVREGRLAAVIDFGGLGVGDPACDLTIAWTFMDAASRKTFREALAVDEALWARGRGWALWKALIVMAKLIDTNAIEKDASAYAVSQILGD